MTQCYRAMVTGKVQGVSFRQAAREQALKRQITGHAVNLADGRVEVVMYGRREALAELCEWLWQGPPAAHVTHVGLEPLEMPSEGHTPADFTTR
ncbi:acylphosphatase [Halomonas piscis]|uniref:acylphosphatase n=1 Tax=Halomonas piscis TaxID=3031727 RepID=A0ABY9YVZ1_9GAMM|nr:acylphosphatase [Halomonas piscis]WNK18937.1 acylphosphatase [Halomonas piscis]